eukprot:TRINITY_DN23946_c0_g1_i1.p1 TRINITY_DN23946_c0_g1~~TRINITY_DN23946_c0_g1_i1.p1  ORF type:complete len:170 (+),score=38.21 TRINITY_DN23946_c0_g1_i1:55-510(+)
MRRAVCAAVRAGGGSGCGARLFHNYESQSPQWTGGAPRKQGPGRDRMNFQFPDLRAVDTGPIPATPHPTVSERVHMLQEEEIATRSIGVDSASVRQINMSVGPEERAWARENRERWRKLEEKDTVWQRAKRWILVHMFNDRYGGRREGADM